MNLNLQLISTHIHHIHRINLYLAVIITLTGVFLSPLVTGTGVHDGLRMGKIFFFAQWMLLVIPVGMVVFIREWKQPVGVLSLLVLLWFGWIIVRGKTGGIWHDEKFFWLAGCFVFFFLAVSIFSGAVQGRQSRGSSRNCGRFYLSNHAMQPRGSGGGTGGFYTGVETTGGVAFASGVAVVWVDYRAAG